MTTTLKVCVAAHGYEPLGWAIDVSRVLADVCRAGGPRARHDVVAIGSVHVARAVATTRSV